MSYSRDDMRSAIRRAICATIEAKELFTDIDNLSGDGDLGISMEKGAYAIQRELDLPGEFSISEILDRCAVSLNREAPSTMGTLTSVAIKEVSKYMEGKEVFSDEDIPNIPDCMARAIVYYGRARIGDKTVLDALFPYSKLINDMYRQSGDVHRTVMAAAEEAILAASGTKGWIARIGRAKWFAERSRNCQDGGATVCAVVVNAMAGGDTKKLLEYYEEFYYTPEPKVERPQPQG